MKRLSAIALVTLILLSLVIIGCSDDKSVPRFARINVMPNCGVMPLEIAAYGITTGGDESGPPTGGNANLEIAWDFGDGIGTGRTSRDFYTYPSAGDYRIIVTGTDPEGQVCTGYYDVTVLADTLSVDALPSVANNSTITTDDTITLDTWAQSCDVDPDIPEDYSNLQIKWLITGPVTIRSAEKSFIFRPTLAGDYSIKLSVQHVAESVWRTVNLDYVVTTP